MCVREKSVCEVCEVRVKGCVWVLSVCVMCVKCVCLCV